MFSVICVWINDWVNNREAGDLRRYRADYDITVMIHMFANSIILDSLIAKYSLNYQLHALDRNSDEILERLINHLNQMTYF